jgi:hypothetical protein
MDARTNSEYIAPEEPLTRTGTEEPTIVQAPVDQPERTPSAMPIAGRTLSTL